MLRRLFYVCIFQLLLLTGLIAKELPDFTDLAEKQSPMVVNITSVQKNRANTMAQMSPEDEQMQEFFRRFGIPMPNMPPNNNRGQPQAPDKQVYATGSGFIIAADGYILTNAHVVKDADEVDVKLNDKREFKAKVVGFDLRTDVALLKVNANNLPKVTVGNPEIIKVGEWVAAIGAPFGLENTMTVGIVSAKGRALPQENFVPFIQTDVAINPGNSGGPLFNLKGEVIGINSQIYSRTGGYMGLSFAIPINVAMDVVNQLKTNGKVIRGWLGIAIQEVTKELSESFGMKHTNGALVAGIEKGAPAEKGGLLPGDVITKFDGKSIEVSADLPKAVGNTKPGKTVVAEVFRKGSIKTLSLTVGEMPSDQAEVVASKSPEKAEVNRMGLVLKEAPPQQRKKLNGKKGLLVIDAQGSAATAGIRRGDIILALNNSEVESAEAFAKDVATIPNGKTVAVLILRNDETLYVPVKISSDR
ncbi:MAG: DegQ family serine endoprotease [Candidatus Methylopumilus sp.]|nr:DegQ family serine endoprotease [Candidatus Methylopumilus sp.]